MYRTATRANNTLAGGWEFALKNSSAIEKSAPVDEPIWN